MAHVSLKRKTEKGPLTMDQWSLMACEQRSVNGGGDRGDVG